jgi:acetyl esterase
MMPIHPLAQESLAVREAAGAKSVEQLSVADARQQAERLIYLQGPPQPVYQVVDHEVDGPNGPIPVRVYTPGPGGPFPALVYFHGGGWVLGSLETVNVVCTQLANAVPCVVVSVNYRHAPDDKFPAAAEDAYAAIRWVADNAASLNVDAGRIAVGGQSAGGNLAAVVALMARDRGGPRLVHQYLNVPVTHYSFDTPSYADNAEGYGLTRAAMLWFWECYLSDVADGANPYASPLRAPDLRGLPPAHVVTAELDPLRDEGNAYAVRLREAGVPVRHTCYEGMVHGFLGPQAFEDIVAGLREAFGG